MEQVRGEHGGLLARFPTLASRTPNSSPAKHWEGVLGHLKAHHTNDKSGLHKARKMIARVK